MLFLTPSRALAAGAVVASLLLAAACTAVPPIAGQDRQPGSGWRFLASDESPAFPVVEVPVIPGPARILSAEFLSPDGRYPRARWNVVVYPRLANWRGMATALLSDAGFTSSGQIRALDESGSQLWMSKGDVTVHLRQGGAAMGGVVYDVTRDLRS